MPKRAFTLVEIAVSVLIGAIVMLAASRLLSSGMKTSTKGAAHLTNVQNASMLMAQLEEDLQRAYNVSFAPAGVPENTVKMLIIEDRNGVATTSAVIYDFIYESGTKPRGIRRMRESGGTQESHPFCKGLDILTCQFTRLDLDGGRIGYQISLKVGTPPSSTEEFELKRFVLCRNHASNTFQIGWQNP